MMRESFNPLWIFLLARDREEGRYVGSTLVLIYPRATFSLPSAIPRGVKTGVLAGAT